jgi:tRNA A37 threonylcarbamoyladenosine dehydratase
MSTVSHDSAFVEREWRPRIFDLSRHKEKLAFDSLKKRGAIRNVIDDYDEQLREYFQILHPDLVRAPDFENRFGEYIERIQKKNTGESWGRWVYYPWNSTAVRVLENAAFQTVRTARNRNLITAGEQKKFYDTVAGIAGLSVGNSIALAIVLQGGARHIKLADHDRLALSNLNRIRAGVEFLGLPKVVMTARQIYELNPYAEVEIFSDGLRKENISRFFGDLDVVVDEIDNLAVKYLIREEARKRKLPVVMAADNGDGGVIDVERYDLNPKQKFFHGRMGKVNYDMLNKLDKRGIGRMITKHVGPENVTERMQESLLQIGHTLVSWPQLGGAALLNGCAVAYCIRRIVNGQPLESNRAIVSLDEKLDPNFLTPRAVRRRRRGAEKFRKIFDL